MIHLQKSSLNLISLNQFFHFHLFSCVKDGRVNIFFQNLSIKTELIHKKAPIVGITFEELINLGNDDIVLLFIYLLTPR
jgi:hypothetical protein